MADLDRFVEAQDAGGTYAAALAELRSGRKRSHWMWFVFPQVAGLGRSATAQLYAVADLGEARSYLADPVLGQRLRESCAVLLGLPGGDAEAVFGGIDAMKLRSSMTLFSRAATTDEDRGMFEQVLEKYFDGDEDDATLSLI